MKTTRYLSFAGLALLSLGAVVMLVAGCQSQDGGHHHAMSSAAPTAADKSLAGMIKPAKGGAELWARNCLPCHNVRSPSVYSDADWDVVMQHMRIRANLAASDTETIAKFLKSAN